MADNREAGHQMPCLFLEAHRKRQVPLVVIQMNGASQENTSGNPATGDRGSVKRGAEKAGL